MLLIAYIAVGCQTWQISSMIVSKFGRLVTLHASGPDYLLHCGMSVAPSSETLSYVNMSKFSKFGSLVTLHASGSSTFCLHALTLAVRLWSVRVKSSFLIHRCKSFHWLVNTSQRGADKEDLRKRLGLYPNQGEVVFCNPNFFYSSLQNISASWLGRR